MPFFTVYLFNFTLKIQNKSKKKKVREKDKKQKVSDDKIGKSWIKRRPAPGK